MRTALWLLAGCAPQAVVPAATQRPVTPPPTEPVATPEPLETADTAEPDGPDTCIATTFDWMAEPGQSPLQDGSEVTMAHGPQGGWHVAVNAGMRGPNWVNLQAIVIDVTTGEQLAGEDNTFDLVLWDWDEDTCGGEMRGMLAYLDDPDGVDQSFICGLVGRTLRLELLADDGNSTSVEVVAAPDPNDVCP